MHKTLSALKITGAFVIVSLVSLMGLAYGVGMIVYLLVMLRII